MAETLSKTHLIYHLRELRKRVAISLCAFIISMVICYCYSQQIYMFLAQPLMTACKGESGRKLIFTGLTEAFFVHVKVACFAGFILAFPIIAQQLYLFAAPGLYKHERWLLIPYLFIAPILFLIGAALAYYYVMPLAWEFFTSFEHPGSTHIMPVVLEARVSEYLALVMSLIIGFGLAFQLPLILVLLAQAGIIKGSWLASVRRYAVVIIFIVAAVLTPPDVLSQIALALPLLLLYEISILICKKIENNNMKQEDA